MKAIKILISSALVLLGQQMSLAQEFPIGAWFPGLFNNQSAHFATRLDQMVKAHFNTIHAALEQRNTAAVNKSSVPGSAVYQATQGRARDDMAWAKRGSFIAEKQA